MGEQFNEDSSKIIIMEFRKFLFITAAEMSRIRRTTGYKKLNPRQFNDGKTAVCYECPYNAPPYVDRVWRAVIAYDAKYKDICYKLCFGYLLRKDPRANLDLSFKRYNDCRLDLYKRCEKVVPFHNCWPKYHTQEEFYNDFVYTVWASPTTINNFKLHLATVPVQPGTINAQLLIENSKKIKSDFQRSFPPECQGRPNGQQNTMNMAAVVNHPFLKSQDPNWRAGALVRIMSEYKIITN